MSKSEKITEILYLFLSYGASPEDVGKLNKELETLSNSDLDDINFQLGTLISLLP